MSRRGGRAAGADGCKAGWLCVTRDAAGRLDSACFATAEALLAQRPRPDALGLDIPIGLPERGARECDRAARAVLGARRSSVFPAPPRAVLPARSFEEACRIREGLEGKRISKQAWGIVPKIREVDAALRRAPARTAWVYEVHPELCFAMWNGAPLQHGKKSAAGRLERLALVSRHFGEAAFAAVRLRHARRGVSDDDVLDAFAALWSAERIVRGLALRLPESPPRDSFGLPMQIVC
jgi:predicted RNase H-like nuclease